MVKSQHCLKLEFHDADTDTDTDILADTSDMRDFLKLFLWQAERHADILATILARMSVSASWNASLRLCSFRAGDIINEAATGAASEPFARWLYHHDDHVELPSPWRHIVSARDIACFYMHVKVSTYVQCMVNSRTVIQLSINSK